MNAQTSAGSFDVAAECASFIEQANAIVALTGAGISTAAGIPDFRGPRGLYTTRRYDPDRVFDINYFHHDPTLFFEFTRDFLTEVEPLQPTFTHRFLATLEQGGKLKAVITQNIDPLHRKAGSQNVVEVHGGYWTSHCLRCHREYDYESVVDMVLSTLIPRCDCGGVIKPDVVFFGEPVRQFEEAQSLASSSDLLFVLGSSLNVYPAASLPHNCRGKVVVVNRGPVNFTPTEDHIIVAQDLDEFFQKVDALLVWEAL